MVDATTHPQHDQLSANWTPARAKMAKYRFDTHTARRKKSQIERAERIKRAELRHADLSMKQLAIDAAVARVKASRKKGML